MADQRSADDRAPWREQLRVLLFEADTPTGKAFDVALLLSAPDGGARRLFVNLFVTYNQRDFGGAERFGIFVTTPKEFLQEIRSHTMSAQLAQDPVDAGDAVAVAKSANFLAQIAREVRHEAGQSHAMVGCLEQRSP